MAHAERMIPTGPGVLRPVRRPRSAVEERRELRADAVTIIVEAVDGYLIGAVPIILADGLYGLFVGKPRVSERSGASRLLLVRSLAQLEGQPASLVLLVFAIGFSQRSLYEDTLGLLYFALGVLLVSGTLYLGARSLSREEAEGRRGEQ